MQLSPVFTKVKCVFLTGKDVRNTSQFIKKKNKEGWKKVKSGFNLKRFVEYIIIHSLSDSLKSRVTEKFKFYRVGLYL